MFKDKNILLGITGGIAAYKACEIIREIKRNNGDVRVVLTNSASKFITPLTLATLSEHAVLMDMFEDEFRGSTTHINVARWADMILVCPATANTIGKIANGIADDLLTTLIMAATVPVVLCPAMNKEMYRNKFFQENLSRLKRNGYCIVESEAGALACGEYGDGRLANQRKILAVLKKILLGKQILVGKKVLITAGRTEEPLDPVRFITNHSTGKMGFALAEAAILNGAEVTLISGPTQLEPFEGVRYFQIKTSDQMAELVEQEYDSHDIILMAAAVSDIKPKISMPQKIKKDKTDFRLELVKTKDILKELGRKKKNKILIGFAVETENEIENAEKKLRTKNLDFIVLNNPTEPGAAFGHDTNRVTIIDAGGGEERLPLMSKFKVAEHILDRVADLI